MNISIVLAQVLGVSFVVLGLSMFLNKKWTMDVVEEILKNQALVWMGGLIALTMGIVFVELNNVWGSGLPLLITILGWLTLLKGIFLLLFPNLGISYYRKMNKGNIFMWAGIVLFVLGLILLYNGFI